VKKTGAAEIRLPWKWTPRPYQARTWKYLSEGGRRAVLRWHRRSGKDEICLHHTACAAFERVASYWHMLPEYGQARKSMWDAINPKTGRRRIDESFPAEIRASMNEQEMKIKFKNGSTWQLVGSDSYDSLVGSPPLGLVFSEYAISNPSAWGYLRPILLENGGWAIFNSTPRGKNHFKSLCDLAAKDPVWLYEALTASQTGVFTKEQLDSELRELQAEHGDEYGKSLWLQEYFCSFDAAILGSIWGDCVARAESEGRVMNIPFEPRFPVSTAWDLGRTDDTAIWFFQMVAGELRIIDYYETNGKDIPHFGDFLRQKSKDRGFTYATHWVPHDAKPRRLGDGGKSILQQLIAQKVGAFRIVPNLDRQEGIQAARATFPRCWFDADRCDSGLEKLRQYRREYNEEKRIFTDNPLHDFTSHAADAFRYLSLIWRHPSAREAEVPLATQLIAGNAAGMRFGKIKDAHLAKMRRERGERIH
jgi:phage terminase large subunit